eukprot:CAMPEP_0184974362 /NCGR_PEP_ID=MMETSP1098-20130426/5885_1 /TAXON_ID=89044 /ORGANISM="Spumella elongata, Strain CCAP 955/1" /LENGTH=415 /DNA_ID=CAMNT_0027496943 /DNA_START=6 /DNA_END=1250 /DNA_ORIENTATION=-
MSQPPKRGKWDSSDDESDHGKPVSKQTKKSAVKNVNVEEAPIAVRVVTEVVQESAVVVDVEAVVPTSVATNDESMDLEQSIESVCEEPMKLEEVPVEPEPVQVPAPRVHNSIFDGCRSVDCYQRINFIDQGTYGMVFKAKCRETGELFALKQIKFGPETSKVGFPITALREINILLALQHPNIVRVKEMVVGSSIDKIYMVMEYCENDLKKCMQMSKQSFSTAEVKQLMVQLLLAIDHMHQKWYIHRDLKTSNLLYSNKGFLAVCDFGLARKYGSPLAPYTFEVITLWYRPPELLLGQRTYSTAVDMWSVGCIFAEMLTGEPLFPGEGEADQIMKIFKILGAPNEDRWPGFSQLPNVSKISWRVPMKSKLRELFPVASFSGGISLSDQGLDLLSKLLHIDPKQRMSASEALKHPW